jgi:NAD(P)-dependent dehydrogenase (short-subunit alcohol dehydrogenase family)
VQTLTLLEVEMAGRRALVTGAGSGIGLATACALTRSGARVAAVVQTDRQSDEVRAILPDAVVFVQDLLDDAACAGLPARAAQAMGGLDALACCAGIFYKKALTRPRSMNGARRWP